MYYEPRILYQLFYINSYTAHCRTHATDCSPSVSRIYPPHEWKRSTWCFIASTRFCVCGSGSAVFLGALQPCWSPETNLFFFLLHTQCVLIVSFWRILVGDVEMFKKHNNSTAVPDTLISAPRTLPGQCEIKCVQLCSRFTDEWERDEFAVVQTSVVSKGLAFLQFGNTEISWSTSSLCTCCRFIQLLNHPVCLYYKKKDIISSENTGSWI